MKRATFSILTIMLWCFGTGQAWADMGPKPTVDIELSADLASQAVSGTFLLCEKQNCSDAQALRDVGPQGFGCIMSASDRAASNHGYVASSLPIGHCGGLAYGFAPFLQLKLNLRGGKELTSSVFTKKGFNAHFRADFIQGRLIVIEQ